jgi:uncharacterized protein (DUF433 family)
MARYALNLPHELKRQAERLALEQGISLNQFILWSVAEKVGELRQELDDPAFPDITYRRGASGAPTPVLRGTGLRVQTLAVEVAHRGHSIAEVAGEYDLPEARIREALAFYEAHKPEIEAVLQAEQALEDSRE